jgi:hypothetical protein
MARVVRAGQSGRNSPRLIERLRDHYNRAALEPARFIASPFRLMRRHVADRPRGLASRAPHRQLNEASSSFMVIHRLQHDVSHIARPEMQQSELES